MSKYAPHFGSNNNPRATASTVCQKCLGTGHFTYQCKNPRPYVSRPSRTQQLQNPRALAKLKADGAPSVEVPEEFKNKKGTANRILEAKEKERARDEGKGKDGERSAKRTKRSSSGSDSDSGSDSGSNSDSSSSSDSDSESSRSRSSRSRSSRSRSPSSSRSRDRKRRVPQKHHSRSASSEDGGRGNEQTRGRSLSRR